MSARATAFAFLHPGVPGAAAPGLALTSDGAVGVVAGDAEIRQAILLLLSTVPGERIMRPDYGCHLDRLVWLPNDDNAAGLASYYVRQAIERFEPRVEIVALDAGADPERPETLAITLSYRIRATLATGTLRVAVDLDGGST